jgi:hypothetical protein
MNNIAWREAHERLDEADAGWPSLQTSVMVGGIEVIGAPKPFISGAPD